MTPDNRATFLEHAKTQSPREACGVLVLIDGAETLITCRNISQDINMFEIDAMEYSEAETKGEVIAIVHSHPLTNPKPSEADRVSCEQTGLPWHIVAVKTGEWFSFAPTGYQAPLIGRTWAHGFLDCYSLVRDYYKQILQIDIPDFDRNYEWWLKGENMYLENYAKAGFREIPRADIQAHDVILLTVRAPVPNHAGIYIPPEPPQKRGVILHHLLGRLSTRDVYDGQWAKYTSKVLRHSSR